MKTLIVGMGEVGTALSRVLSDYNPAWNDPGRKLYQEGGFDIMHICFPYSDKFIDYVNGYQNTYRPKYTVIHSTVPVGTSLKVEATHSPIRGLHPNLESGIRTFEKFIGGPQASEVADYFRRAGMKVVLFDKAETTEAMKLFDTEYYKACIEFALRVKKYCNEHDLNFHEVYTLANIGYNRGYVNLGHPEFVRPVLQPIMQEIGGHCVLPNSEFLSMSEYKD